MRRVPVFLTIWLLLLLPLPATAELTQRDLMIGLVDGLGWSFGLPDRPEESDYLRILLGNRKFRLEIEEVYDPESRVVLEEIYSFGTFSGQGWIRVPNRATAIPLQFNLPLSGTYRVKARVFRGTHTLDFGAAQLTAIGGDTLQDVEAGTVELKAGLQTVTVTAPPRGGIDFIELEALPAPEIAPAGGWNLEAPLTYDDLALTTIQVLGLYPSLPPAGEELVLEAEDFPLPANTRITSSYHLGQPSNSSWVSVGADSVTFDIGIEVPQAGIYDVTIRCVGTDPIRGQINTQTIQASPQRRFSNQKAGGVNLEQGANPFSIIAPPHCGLDQFILTPRASSPEAMKRLVGLPQSGPPTPETFNRLLKLLAAFAVPR